MPPIRKGLPADLPVCPGCGYDLSGVAAAWRDACPLDGTCSECGLEFRWFDVFYPRANLLRGFVEHARSRVEFIRWAWRTWVWTLLPGGFWGRLAPHRRVNRRALLLWPLILLVPLHIGSSLLSVVLQWLQLRPYGGVSGPFAIRYVTSFTYPFVVFDQRVGGGPQILPLEGRWPGYVLPALAFGATWAALLLILVVTRRRARVGAAHVARAIVYGMSWIVALALFRLVRNAWAVTGSWYDSLTWSRSGIGLVVRSSVDIVYLRDLAPVLVGAALFAWMAVWWWRAVRVGWDLPRSRAIWLLITGAAGLSAALTSVMFSLGPIT